MPAPIQALGPLRHACHGCGACCTGHSVRLVGDEPARIAAIAQQLALPSPVSAGRRGPVLAFVNARCPFLDAQRRCRIHGEIGPEAKPAVCRQYPLRSIATESGQRVAVDPGCGSNGKVWQDGPELDASALLPAPTRWLPAKAARQERQVLAWLQPEGGENDLAEAVFKVAGRALDADGLDAFAARAARAVTGMRIPVLLSTHAPTLSAWLDGVAAAGVPAKPRWVALTADQQRFVLELARRSVYLRSGPVQPMAEGLALGTIVGALACAWADPTPGTFEPALTAWTRLLRLMPAWMALYPGPKAVQRLAKG